MTLTLTSCLLSCPSSALTLEGHCLPHPKVMNLQGKEDIGGRYYDHLTMHLSFVFHADSPDLDMAIKLTWKPKQLAKVT
jgi:hypothetical protein